MSFSFDDSEFLDEIEEQGRSESDMSEAEETNDPTLMDVDLRLETADFYRAILKHEFFDGTSQAANLVEDEIRNFIRGRLEVLLGIRSPQAEADTVPQSEFTPEEIQALKALASKVLHKPALALPPVVKPMKPPKPKVAATVKVTAPKVRTAKNSTAKSVQPKAHVESPPKKAQATNSKKKTKDVAVESEARDLHEGAIIDEGKKKYRVERSVTGKLYRKDISSAPVIPEGHKSMSMKELEIASRVEAENQIAELSSKGWA